MQLPLGHRIDQRLEFGFGKVTAYSSESTRYVSADRRLSADVCAPISDLEALFRILFQRTTQLRVDCTGRTIEAIRCAPVRTTRRCVECNSPVNCKSTNQTRSLQPVLVCDLLALRQHKVAMSKRPSAKARTGGEGSTAPGKARRLA